MSFSFFLLLGRVVDRMLASTTPGMSSGNRHVACEDYGYVRIKRGEAERLRAVCLPRSSTLSLSCLVSQYSLTASFGLARAIMARHPRLQPGP